VVRAAFRDERIAEVEDARVCRGGGRQAHPVDLVAGSDDEGVVGSSLLASPSAARPATNTAHTITASGIGNLRMVTVGYSRNVEVVPIWRDDFHHVDPV
jgi:hypothetical protein